MRYKYQLQARLHTTAAALHCLLTSKIKQMPHLCVR